jgi:predicted ATPase
MTKVINLWGGPGSGKSTIAAGLFSAMKSRGMSVELVREYVKDVVWDTRGINWYDQPYFLGKQWKKEAMLYGKVDYIITDSPFEFSAVYGRHYVGITFLDEYVANLKKFAGEHGVTYHDIFIVRDKPYVCSGRNETEEEAKKIDGIMSEHLGKNKAWVLGDPTICVPSILNWVQDGVI